MHTCMCTWPSDCVASLQVKQQGKRTKWGAYRALAQLLQRASFDEHTAKAYEVVLKHLSQFWENMSEKTYLIWVQTADLDWAFRVFHSLNDTGVPLKDIDKLKAHMLNSWASLGDAQLKNANKWIQCIEMVGGEDEFDQIVRYIAIGAGMGLRENLLTFMVSLFDLAAWLSPSVAKVT